LSRFSVSRCIISKLAQARRSSFFTESPPHPACGAISFPPSRRTVDVSLLISSGWGKSGKPPITYRQRDHIAYLDAFLNALVLSEVTFVLYDWGGRSACTVSNGIRSGCARLPSSTGIFTQLTDGPILIRARGRCCNAYGRKTRLNN
jgi:hypothetical protein